MALREASRLLDADRAEDAAQECLLRAWRSSHTLHGNDPTPWVRAIARREALRIGMEARVCEVAEDHGVGSTTSATEPVDLKLDVKAILDRLSPSERRDVFLRHWADMTTAAIAMRTGRPSGTVKVRLHRTYAKLSQLAGSPA